MSILIIDTCSCHFSIGIARDGIISSKIIEYQQNKQAELLVLKIEEVLLQSQIEYADLRAVAVTIGPGSFTGIKMGLTAASAISVVQSIPCFGFSTLEVLAYQLGGDCMMTVAAGRGRYYCQNFDINCIATDKITLLDATEMLETNRVVKGDFEAKVIIDPSIICMLAVKEIKRNLDVVELPRPIYNCD